MNQNIYSNRLVNFQSKQEVEKMKMEEGTYGLRTRYGFFNALLIKIFIFILFYIDFYVIYKSTHVNFFYKLCMYSDFKYVIQNFNSKIEFETTRVI